jgi:acyl carrier protein
MAFSQEDIFKKVQDILVESLGVDADEVTPDASLKDDLGAESIDFLDISFRLEKAFTTDPAKPFKIPKGELFPESMDPKFVQDNMLTDAGLEEVGRRMPHADLTELKASRDTNLLMGLFTVRDITDYVDRKLKAA